jgi:hypothetical protein
MAFPIRRALPVIKATLPLRSAFFFMSYVV